MSRAFCCLQVRGSVTFTSRSRLGVPGPPACSGNCICAGSCYGRILSRCRQEHGHTRSVRFPGRRRRVDEAHDIGIARRPRDAIRGVRHATGKARRRRSAVPGFSREDLVLIGAGTHAVDRGLLPQAKTTGQQQRSRAEKEIPHAHAPRRVS